MSAQWLTNARLADGRVVEIMVDEGRIAAINDPCVGPCRHPGAQDLGGRLVVPAFVDGHAHLDKTLFGQGWYSRSSWDDVASAIDRERRLRATWPSSVSERAEQLLAAMVGLGTGAVRCHVDVDVDVGLAGLRSICELRARRQDVVSIQIVAFPQNGVVRSPGTADLLEAAMSEGADVIGGIDPAGIDGDVVGQLDVVFGIAERHAADVDIHLHDGGDVGVAELTAIAERTRVLGMGGHVTVSHAYVLADLDGTGQGRLADLLANARVAVATSGPAHGTPPVQTLVRAGVEVFAGSDNVRDIWSPYGSGDMLERATIVAYQSGFTTDDELELAMGMVTERARRAAGFDQVSIAAGSLADLVVIDASCVAEAVAGHPGDRAVWHHGTRVATPTWWPAGP